MSSTEEDREFYKSWSNVAKRRRTTYGVECPKCKELRPKACATILLPRQKCKVDGYRDPRPRITSEQEDALWEAEGFTRVKD